ncbi:hypothetical protein BH10BAC5_BH10BAC5_22290 [soil metagenome]
MIEENNKKTDIYSRIRSVLPLFGSVYMVFLIIVIGAGYFYYKNIDFIFMNSKGVLPKYVDSIYVPKDLAYVKGSITPPVDITKVSNPTPEMIAKGKTLFATNCSGCHGAEGMGDGVAGATLNPKPRNFHELNGWKNGPKITGMYKTLQEGIAGTAMASFSMIPPEDRFALISYIRTLTPNYPKDSPDSLKILDQTYKLSEGSQLPNQMPVKVAIQKVLTDYHGNDSLIQKVSDKIKTDLSNKDAGAVLFNRLSSKKQKALTALVNYTKWNDNKNDFVKLIGNDPNTYGFKAEITALSDEDWNILYNYMKNALSPAKV